jgi:hypothetical protein
VVECSQHLAGEAFEAMLGPCVGLFSQAISRATRSNLVRTMCTMIAGAPHKRALEETEQLCAPALEVVLMLKEGSPAAPSERALDAALRELDQVCACMILVHPVPELEHPVLALLKAVWPALEVLFVSPADVGVDEDMVAVAWTMVLSAIKTLESLTSVFLDALLGSDGETGLLVRSFGGCPTKPALTCALQLYAEFYKWEACTEPLAHLLTQLTDCYVRNFTTLQSDSDITSAYFEMMMKCIQFAPQCALLNPDLGPLVVQLATEGLKCQELPSIRAAVTVLERLIDKVTKVSVVLDQGLHRLAPNWLFLEKYLCLYPERTLKSCECLSF